MSLEKELFVPMKLFWERLSKLNTGDRAALKRAAGMMLGEADGKAMTVFYRCLPAETPRWQEDRWFAVACLRCLWEPDADEGERLEKIIAQMIQDEKLSSSTQHRIEVLLDTVWDEDGYLLTKLARLVKLIRQKSNQTPVNCTKLLKDLIYWNAENQSVQRKWAQAIFSTPSKSDEEKEK